MRIGVVVSMIIFLAVFGAMLISIFWWEDLPEFNYFVSVVIYFFVSFCFVQYGYYTLYKALKARHKWSEDDKVAVWMALFGINVSFTISFVLRAAFANNFAIVVIGRLFGLQFFYSVGFWAKQIDEKALPEFTMKYILFGDLDVKSDESGDNNEVPFLNGGNSEDIEAIVDKLRSRDWSTANKLNIFPASFVAYNNLLNVMIGLFYIVSLLIHLFLYAIFIVIHVLLWMIGVFLCCECRGFQDYFTLFIMNEIESLSLQSIARRGIIWRMRYYIITFIDGINAFVLIISGDPDKKVNYYRGRVALKRKKLKENTTFIGSDGGILCTDYNYASRHYMDASQAHEFATRYVMHPVVSKWCPYYSLAQTIGTRNHAFLREMFYKLDAYLLDNFEHHRVPNDLFLPLFDSAQHRDNISMDDCFAFAISTFYYKLFRKRLSNQDLDVFKKGRSGLVSIGVLPNSLINMIGNKLFARKYWSMLALFRDLMLKEFKNHFIVKSIIESARKHGFTSDNELDLAINSFCVELIPGNAGIASVLRTALLFLAKNEENINEFVADPENFVLESLRLAGVPSSGRTVINTREEVEINGETVALEAGHSIIHAFDLMNRNEDIFKNGDDFDSRRENLKEDLFIFGNREQFIRNKTAKRSCPLRNYAIVAVQELIGRMYEIKGLSLKLGEKQFRNSFELNDDEKIQIVFSEKEAVKSARVHKSLDRYSQILIPPLFSMVKSWNEKPPINVPVPQAAAVAELLEKESLVNLYQLPIFDQALERSVAKDMLLDIFAIEEVFPIKDDSATFQSNEEMMLWRKKHVILPKVNVVWTELISDDAMSLFAFSSIACLSTKRIAAEPAAAEKEEGYFVPANAAFINDWRILNAFEVRSGLEKYGAAAIYLSFLDRVIDKKSDDNKLWQYAKYAWKTNVFVGVTLIDHAGFVHLLESNQFVTATREELPADHPFRRLFDIFTYRTIYINLGVKRSLLSDNMLIERVSGFTYDSICAALKAVADLYEFKALHERIDKSMLNLPDKIYPLQHDATQIFRRMILH